MREVFDQVSGYEQKTNMVVPPVNVVTTVKTDLCCSSCGYLSSSIVTDQDHGNTFIVPVDVLKLALCETKQYRTFDIFRTKISKTWVFV